MYAIVRIGGRQYRAEAGVSLEVEKLPYEEGEDITLDEVLMVADGDSVSVGQPTVDGASVSATIEKQYRGKKLIVFKYNQRTNYRRKKGHRQYYTTLKINTINA
ncbi:MAG: 50S ribosomal protein L21 [Aggregatilineales bacterium]